MFDPDLAEAHRQLVATLRVGRERLKGEGLDALTFSLDQARCNRKFAAAEVVNNFRKYVAELVGTEAFPVAQVDFVAYVASLSGVAFESEYLYSDEQRTAIEELTAGGWLKRVEEVFSPERTVVFYTIDFAYTDLDRTNG